MAEKKIRKATKTVVVGKLSGKELRIRAARNALASGRLEGLVVDDGLKREFQLFVDGKISAEQLGELAAADPKA